jgi:hypothetical protein
MDVSFLKEGFEGEQAVLFSRFTFCFAIFCFALSDRSSQV